MSLYRDGITAPGLRDNDWAHTPYDDMRLATAAGRGFRDSRPLAEIVDADVRNHAREQSVPPYRAHSAVTHDAAGALIMSADTLAGDEVRNAAGELLGEMTDIMIDVPSGRIAYAIVSVPGVLGVGDKLFAIPWKSLRRDREHNCFRLDVAKARFDDAPRFDKDHWPSMADEHWALSVHAYYKATPYWE
jgi:sporulation protein YlmC with PRC-barrel domain